MPAVDATDIVLSHFASYPSFSPSVIFPQLRHRAIPLTTPSPGAVAYAQQTTDCTDSTRASALVDVIDPGRPPQQGNHATSSEALACVASHPVWQQSVVVVHTAAPIARSCIFQHKHINKHINEHLAARRTAVVNLIPISTLLRSLFLEHGQFTYLYTPLRSRRRAESG
jgi:hypothetical protein